MRPGSRRGAISAREARLELGRRGRAADVELELLEGEPRDRLERAVDARLVELEDLHRVHAALAGGQRLGTARVAGDPVAGAAMEVAEQHRVGARQRKLGRRQRAVAGVGAREHGRDRRVQHEQVAPAVARRAEGADARGVELAAGVGDAPDDEVVGQLDGLWLGA